MCSEDEFDSFSKHFEQSDFSEIYFISTNPYNVDQNNYDRNEIEGEKNNEDTLKAIENNFPYNTLYKKEEKNKDKDGKIKSINTATTDKLSKKKKKIFRIINYKLKPGRRKKNSLLKPAIKDKYHKDNIQNRILTNYINSTLHYLNLHLSKKKIKLLQKIVPLIKEYSTAENSRKFLQKTIGEILSVSVSDRNTRFKNDKNYNKKLIKKLRTNSLLIEVNNILNKTVKEMYEIYISNTIPEYSLDNDLIKLKQKDNDNDYVLKYKSLAENLIDIIINKKSRNCSKLYI